MSNKNKRAQDKAKVINYRDYSQISPSKIKKRIIKVFKSFKDLK
jgi:hypothetical protein